MAITPWSLLFSTSQTKESPPPAKIRPFFQSDGRAAKGLFRHRQPAAARTPPQLLQRKKLVELLSQIDEKQQLDTAVEEFLEHLAHDFIERVVAGSCDLAKHRGSDTLELRDIQLHLDRTWDLRVPGFGVEEPRVIPPKPGNEAHKQKLAAVAKAEQMQPKRKRLDPSASSSGK